MNKPDVRTYQTKHGHVGEFRLAWRSDFYPVRVDGAESPIRYFHSAESAEIEAWRTMNRIEQKVMVRDGEVMQPHSAADALFKLPPFVKQKGSSRLTMVTSKGGLMKRRAKA